MKKIWFVIVISVLCTSILPACTGVNPNPADANIAVIKGPSSIGMVKLMDEADSGVINTNNYSFEIYASADEIVPIIVQGNIDIAALPANLSSVL